MIIILTKDHFSGLKKGDVRDVDSVFGERFIKDGFAKKALDKEFTLYKKSLLGKKTNIKPLQEAIKLANSGSGECEGCESDSKCDDCEEKE